MSGRKQLVMVSIINPLLCEACRFNKGKAKVTLLNNQEQEVDIICTRGDCDNWSCDRNNLERITKVEEFEKD